MYLLLLSFQSKTCQCYSYSALGPLILFGIFLNTQIRFNVLTNYVGNFQYFIYSNLFSVCSMWLCSIPNMRPRKSPLHEVGFGEITVEKGDAVVRKMLMCWYPALDIYIHYREFI